MINTFFEITDSDGKTHKCRSMTVETIGGEVFVTADGLSHLKVPLGDITTVQVIDATGAVIGTI